MTFLKKKSSMNSIELIFKSQKSTMQKEKEMNFKKYLAPGLFPSGGKYMFGFRWNLS